VGSEPGESWYPAEAKSPIVLAKAKTDQQVNGQSLSLA
jgi:hypothetical protein